MDWEQKLELNLIVQLMAFQVFNWDHIQA